MRSRADVTPRAAGASNRPWPRLGIRMPGGAPRLQEGRHFSSPRVPPGVRRGRRRVGTSPRSVTTPCRCRSPTSRARDAAALLMAGFSAHSAASAGERRMSREFAADLSEHLRLRDAGDALRDGFHRRCRGRDPPPRQRGSTSLASCFSGGVSGNPPGRSRPPGRRSASCLTSAFARNACRFLRAAPCSSTPTLTECEDPEGAEMGRARVGLLAASLVGAASGNRRPDAARRRGFPCCRRAPAGRRDDPLPRAEGRPALRRRRGRGLPLRNRPRPDALTQVSSPERPASADGLP